MFVVKLRHLFGPCCFAADSCCGNFDEFEDQSCVFHEDFISADYQPPQMAWYSRACVVQQVVYSIFLYILSGFHLCNHFKCMKMLRRQTSRCATFSDLTLQNDFQIVSFLRLLLIISIPSEGDIEVVLLSSVSGG